MIADPDVNLLVVGDHPTKKRPVYYWYEVCDAVQSDIYTVDGIKVSDFVLPFYFTPEKENEDCRSIAVLSVDKILLFLISIFTLESDGP